MTNRVIFEAFLAMGRALQTHGIDPSTVTLRMSFEDAHILRKAIEAEFHPKFAPEWASMMLYDKNYQPPRGEVCKLNGIAVIAEPAK